MSWRPEGWKNLYGTIEFTGHPQIDADLYVMALMARAYEAGADAMYEAAYQKGKAEGRKELLNELRNKGKRQTEIMNLFTGEITRQAGTLVFIPDDKEVL